jgi:hypothetical protein
LCLTLKFRRKRLSVDVPGVAQSIRRRGSGRSFVSPEKNGWRAGRKLEITLKADGGFFPAVERGRIC